MNYKIFILLLFLCFLFLGCSETKNKKLKESKIEAVKIGKQIWMKNNLDVGHYRNGDSIPEVKDQEKWLNTETGAWCYYKNDTKNGKIYGKLYNWYAVNDPRGLAPEGWHIPTEDEWIELETFLDGRMANEGKIKEIGTEHRSSPNIEAINSSGFFTLQGGYRSYEGTFSAIKSYGLWWSSSEFDIGQAFNRSSMFSTNTLYRGPEAKWCGFSVRCIKN
jgi:uncharacterized protein (TIGR02145 family)